MSNRHLYAQLASVEGQQIVVGLSDLSGQVEQANMIELQSLTDAKLGDIYENGGFTTPPPPAEPVE